MEYRSIKAWALSLVLFIEFWGMVLPTFKYFALIAYYPILYFSLLFTYTHIHPPTVTPTSARNKRKEKLVKDIGPLMVTLIRNNWR